VSGLREALAEQVLARLAALRERFGDDDPDVRLFTAYVAAVEQAHFDRVFGPEVTPARPPK
jgi:hypothetical protein